MKKVFNVSKFYLNTILTKKNVIIILGLISLHLLISLSVSNVFDDFATFGICYRNTVNNFFGSYFSLLNIIVITSISVIVLAVINSNTINKVDYVHLTGGISRRKLIFGQLLGFIIFIASVFLLILVLLLATIIFFDFRIDSLIILKGMLGYFANALLIVSLVFFFYLITENYLCGMFPMITYFVFNLLFNSTYSATENPSLLYKILTFIMPIFETAKYSPQELLTKSDLYAMPCELYTNYGTLFFIIFLIVINSITVYLYKKKNL